MQWTQSNDCFLFLACSKPRALVIGWYDEELVKNYREGQKVSFTCDYFAKRIPSDGIIECGPNGWNIDHDCAPFIPSKYLVIILCLCRIKLGIRN